jgi:hypothetical protein
LKNRQTHILRKLTDLQALVLGQQLGKQQVTRHKKQLDPEEEAPETPDQQQELKEEHEFLFWTSSTLNTYISSSCKT